MLKFILLGCLIFLSACVTGNEPEKRASQNKPDSTKTDSVKVEPTKKSLGYGIKYCNPYFELCGIDKRVDSLISFKIYNPPSDTFFIYISQLFLNGNPSKETIEVLHQGNEMVFDAEDKCLTFEQSGIDTILIDKKKVIVSVPVEKCVPYMTKAMLRL